MGFNINDIFGLNTPAPAQTPVPNATTQPAPGVTPSDGKPPFEKSTTPDPAPIDKFEDLFKVTPVDPNAPAVVDNNSPYFTRPTDEQLMQQVAGMKFLNNEANKELIMQAAKGDPDALAQVINIAAQQAYAQGAKLSANVAETATRTGVERVNSGLPSQIRSNLARTQVQELNPIFNHPAMAPMVQAARATIEDKYPNASPSELARMTNEYMESVRDAMTKPNPTPQQTSGGNTQIENFSTFFSGR